ncbi:MAG: class III extradiol dioxygenase subunit B-like domain-containing protein [Patescibacteria group bacterium]|jgi:AmmeMemoRadiSam system protein B
MSLVFAAISPHPPLLIPAIGKGAIKKIQRTKIAIEKLEEDLYLSRPEIIVIISPHSHQFNDAFSLNLSQKFESDLRQFGDLTTNLSFTGETQLPYTIRSESYKNDHHKIVIVNEPLLDHGTVVPLYYLTKHLPNVKILPVSQSGLDSKNHLEFGYLMKDQIMKSNKRIAVIASGDLSHCLSSDAPAGFHKNGAIFDSKIQEFFISHNTAGLLTLENDIINDAVECGFRSFLILMGVLRDVNYRYESYSYESPFGVGYLTANFVL